MSGVGYLIGGGLDVLDACLDVAEVLVVNAPSGRQRLHQTVHLHQPNARI